MKRDTGTTDKNVTKLSIKEEEGITIPVVKEDVVIGKREVETGRVVVEKRVGFEDRVIELPLTETHYEEKRVAINRHVEELPQTRTEGDTLIIPVVREETVVTKRIILLEEIHLTKVVSRHDHSKTIRVHQESVTVKRE
ncbi:MAG: DUF2382 domain-containing protein [Saprospiraceae bacterium]